MHEQTANTTENVKFLIIRFSSIGDIVLTTPVIRCLKQQVPGAEVHVLVKKQYAFIHEANPYIDKIHVFDYNFNELISNLKNEFFDYIIDLQNNLRSSRIRSKLGLVSFAFNKLNWQKWLLVNFNIDKLPHIHIVDRYMETTKLFDVNNDQQGLDYFIPPHNNVDLGVFPPDFRNGYIAMAIGAQHATKKMPVNKLIALCNKITKPIILLGDKNDATIADEICSNSKGQIYNACGKFNLHQSASIVKQAQWVITHDTGLMHIASAFKQKIISVWGNTVPKFGMYPYMPHSASIEVEVNKLKCRPCTKIGFKKCPKSHFKCMNFINEDSIASVVNA